MLAFSSFFLKERVHSNYIKFDCSTGQGWFNLLRCPTICAMCLDPVAIKSPQTAMPLCPHMQRVLVCVLRFSDIGWFLLSSHQHLQDDILTATFLFWNRVPFLWISHRTQFSLDSEIVPIKIMLSNIASSLPLPIRVMDCFSIASFSVSNFILSLFLLLTAALTFSAPQTRVLNAKLIMFLSADKQHKVPQFKVLRFTLVKKTCPQTERNRLHFIAVWLVSIMPVHLVEIGNLPQVCAVKRVWWIWHGTLV